MKNIGVICYSPTGSTRRICETVAASVPDAALTILDLTLPARRAEWLDQAGDQISRMDHLVVGIPVYAGKMPALARGFLERIPGLGRTATAVAVYGNNDYGVALSSLVALLNRREFKVIHAGAFIGQHTYSGNPPVAPGRPDTQDLQAAASWGRGMNFWLEPLEENQVPRKANLFTRMKSEMSIQPTHVVSACLQCGICGERCPAGIIDSETGAFLSQEARKRCQGCLACVKNCPNGGRIFQTNSLQKMMGRRILAAAARQRCEPLMVP